MSKIEKALEKAKKTRGGREKDRRSDLSLDAGTPEGQEAAFAGARTIPIERNHVEKNRLMTLSDDPSATDHYNLLRTQVLWKTRPKGHNTIMVTSALDGEGKTVTAINLAVSIARDVKHSVLLVDTDLRNPRINSYLGSNVKKGLTDYILNDTPLEELIINPGVSKMQVLPAGKALAGSTEILGSPRMEQLVEKMKHQQPDRYIIFDTPPVLAVPDALVFSSYVDVVIIVVEAGRTGKDQIRKAVELLEGRNILGLVMNKAKETNRGYGYYHYHHEQGPDHHPVSGSEA
jgi:protein-tyrosine kinase